LELLEVRDISDVARLVRRGDVEDDPAVFERAREIVRRVRADGDRALRELTRELDHVELGSIRVARGELEAALERTPRDVVKALKLAAKRIKVFARRQRRSLREFQTTRGGVTLGQRVIPLARAGVLVPGGRRPLPQAALMGVVPALAAGVKEVVVATPPSPETGRPSDVVLAACALAGATEVFAVGGAPAIAALAHGTETIRPVDKLTGPGDVSVQAAKTIVSRCVAVDPAAGPTEALVIAEPDADPEIAAWDLVASCEHDPRARAWLVTWSRDLVARVDAAGRRALEMLGAPEVAAFAFARATAVLVPDEGTAVSVSDALGAENVAIHGSDPRRLARALRNYGALFLGPFAAIPLGELLLGPNATLPTGGAARFAGGLSCLEFVNVRTYAYVEPRGFARLEGPARTIARAAGLSGDERAIASRRRGKRNSGTSTT
jgi:histidinol dehydrogenase